jgi:hypothetical protein
MLGLSAAVGELSLELRKSGLWLMKAVWGIDGALLQRQLSLPTWTLRNPWWLIN